MRKMYELEEIGRAQRVLSEKERNSPLDPRYYIRGNLLENGSLDDSYWLSLPSPMDGTRTFLEKPIQPIYLGTVKINKYINRVEDSEKTPEELVRILIADAINSRKNSKKIKDFRSVIPPSANAYLRKLDSVEFPLPREWAWHSCPSPTLFLEYLSFFKVDKPLK